MLSSACPEHAEGKHRGQDGRMKRTPPLKKSAGFCVLCGYRVETPRDGPDLLSLRIKDAKNKITKRIMGI